MLPFTEEEIVEIEYAIDGAVGTYIRLISCAPDDADREQWHRCIKTCESVLLKLDERRLGL